MISFIKNISSSFALWAIGILIVIVSFLFALVSRKSEKLHKIKLKHAAENMIVKDKQAQSAERALKNLAMSTEKGRKLIEEARNSVTRRNL